MLAETRDKLLNLISMENTYYVPEISEFHYGFEYEVKSDKWCYFDNTNGEWVKETFIGGETRDDLGEMSTIINVLDGFYKDIEVRVKCLDREDIESLGFKFLGKAYFQDFKLIVDWKDKMDYKNSAIELKFWEKKQVIQLTSLEFENRIDDVSDDKCIFFGGCKNKSELKRVLKMIGYGE